MQGVRPLALGGALVAAGEAAAGIVALAALGPETIALFLLACGVATAATTVGLAALIAHRRGPGDSPGGSARWPPPRGPEQPPPWWPGFERDFWAHVERRPRTLA
jgi:hypothetical protein